ncbi:MAG TPA: ribonuclease R [Bacillota bacterium]
MSAPNTLDEARILRFLREQAQRPMSFGELARALGAAGRRRRELAGLLAALEARGAVVRTRAERYGLPERMNLVVGRLQRHRRGFGFVIPERDDIPDVYIASDRLGSAVHQDRVIARLLGRAGDGRRAEGEIIRVLERAHRQVVGRLVRRRHFAFVTPSDPRLDFDVIIPAGELGGAAAGEIVVAEVTGWPERPRSPEGRVVSRLGVEGDPGIDVAVVMFQYGLEPDFDPDVLAEAERVPQEVRPEDCRGRLDLRDRVVFTIDGADARDLDDAVSLEAPRHPRARWRLGVHIADVAHYVAEGGALDREAARRGTSVYLVDRVVPMLPPALSNGICSLHPGVDRLTLSVFMEFDERGRVLDYEITPSVIRSRQRLTYETVHALLSGADRRERRRHRDLLPVLEEMHRLAQVLFTRRLSRGSIDFDLPEAKVVLDDQGRPVDILVRRRNTATQLIEEFMIACNETVARHHQRLEVPFLYRVHEPPGDEDVASFEEFVSHFGLRLRRRGARVRPADFQRLLERVRDTDEAYLISSVMLRTMARARYAGENLGHFGLASDCYAHFTSPIRRYPDLVIHRITREVLARGDVDAGRRERLLASLPAVAAHCSAMERLAEEAERETVDLKKAEFMADRVGEVFTGIVSGVTHFGLFVALPNTVEGLVHVSTMVDDYYHFDEPRFALVGERRGRVFRLGDAVRVQLVRVDRDERRLDFELVDDDAGEAAGGPGADPAGGRAGRRRRRGGGRRQGR